MHLLGRRLGLGLAGHARLRSFTARAAAPAAPPALEGGGRAEEGEEGAQGVDEAAYDASSIQVRAAVARACKRTTVHGGVRAAMRVVPWLPHGEGR